MLLCRQARDPEIWEGGCSGLLFGIDGRESRDGSGSRDELWDALFWGVRHWIKFVSESEARKGVRKEGVQAEKKSQRRKIKEMNKKETGALVIARAGVPEDEETALA